MAKYEVTYYYMNGCGYCVKFKPEWDSFTKQYGSGNNIKTRIVEANNMTPSDTINGSQINGFPTIKITNLSNMKEYQYTGQRNSNALITYINNMNNIHVGGENNNLNKYSAKYYNLLKQFYTYKIDKYQAKLDNIAKIVN